MDANSDWITSGSPVFSGGVPVVLTVTDEAGNTATSSCDVTVTVNTNLAVSAVAVDETCQGLDDGELAVTVSGGTAPFIFTAVSQGTGVSTSASGASPQTITGLAPGEYIITSEDASGCIGTTNQTVGTVIDVIDPVAICPTTPPTVVLDGSGNGTLAADALAGGNSTDNCSVVVVETSPMMTFTCADAPSQMVVLTATDEQGNTSTISCVVTIDDSACCDIAITNVATTDEQCPGDDDGTITVTATCASCTNGTADIRYSIDGTDFTNTTGVFTGLADATYTVTVRDVNDIACTDTDSGTVADGVDASAPTVVCQDVTINLDGSGNGSLTAAEVNNGSTDDCSLEANLIYSLSQTSFTCSDIEMVNPNAAWQYVGSPNITGSSSQQSMAIHPVTGEPYISFPDGGNANKLSVMKFDGTNWSYVGTAGFSTDLAGHTSIKFSPANEPYVAYYDNSNYRTTVSKFDGTNWTIVGAANFSEPANYIQLEFSPTTGEPYVAYQSGQNKASVMKYDGTNWVYIGTPSFSSATVLRVSLSINTSGTPFVALRDGGQGNKLSVMEFDGTNWITVGSAGFSNGSVQYPSLEFSPSGELHVAYQDLSTTNSNIVKKFDGTNWIDVGSTGTSGSYQSLAFSPTGEPTVLHSSSTVMKYDGTQWNLIGGTSLGNASSYLTLAYSPTTGEPYAAFRDGSNSFGTSVMNFSDGSSPVSTILTVTDEAGNSATCTANVTVEDNLGPDITCPAGGGYELDANECDATLSFTATATDNCGVVSSIVYTVDGLAITFPYDFQVGTTQVVVEATDDNGNMSTCLFDVSVGGTNSATTADFVENSAPHLPGESQGSLCYELTPAINDQGGSVWYQNKVNLDLDFCLEFDLYLGNTDGADGAAFVLQPLNTGQGATGGGMGYQNTHHLSAVEFDTHHNNQATDPYNDPIGDHIAIMKDGDVDHGNAGNLAGPFELSSDIEDGQYHAVKISWNGTTNQMDVYFDGALAVSYTGDITTDIFAGDPNVFWGWTAGTGGLNNEQKVCMQSVNFTDAIEATANISEPCDGESQGEIDLVPTGGIGTLTVAWSNGATTEDVTGLTMGTYEATVTDQCGTTATFSYTLNDLDTPSLAAIATQSNTCPVETFDVSTINIVDNNSVAGTTTTFHSAMPTSAADVSNVLGSTTITADQTVFVMVVSADGCYDVESFMVDIVTCCDIAITDIATTDAEKCSGNGCSENEVNISITFDDYPGETSWTILDGNGVTVASGGPYGSQPAGSTISINECLDNGCYDFVISDVYGDGICCDFGNGSYIVTSGGVTLASGGANVGFSETTNFCLTAAGSDGTMTVTANCNSCVNGTSDIEYSIDGTNFQASNVFSGLSANTYTVTVRDMNSTSCTDTDNGVVNPTAETTPPTAICQDITLTLFDTGMTSLLGGNDAFTEDFSSEVAGNGQTTLTNWTVTGNIDINNTSYPTNPGNVIDMEGTPGNAIIETTSAIFVDPSTYQYSMFIGRESPNGTSDEKVQVTIVDVNNGDVYMDQIFDSADPAVTVSRLFTIPVSTQVNIRIEELGPENFGGTVIGSIALTSITPDVDNGSTDNCGLVTYAFDVTEFDCSNIGANTVTMTVTDAVGNTSTCTSVVTIEDGFAPTITAQDITVSSVNGVGTITANDANNGSSDLCSGTGLTLTVTQSSFSCADLNVLPECYTVSTIAGTANTDGNVNGTGTAALFNRPRGLAVDSNGDIIFSDRNNHQIKRITPSGVVTTIAGSGVFGNANGTGTAAEFAFPDDILIRANGDILVSEFSSRTIRKITPAGVVSTFAGIVNTDGSLDGDVSVATFGAARGLAEDSQGNIFVSDFTNNNIRKITPGGMVSTLAGTAGVTGSADGTGAAAEFNRPSYLAIDENDNLYLTSFSNAIVRKITPAGVVTTIAGTVEVSDFADGVGSAALFGNVNGLQYFDGYLYISDQGNNSIRRLNIATNEVKTISGNPGTYGTVINGTSGATFNAIYDVAVVNHDLLYAVDLLGHTVRKLESIGDCFSTYLIGEDAAGNTGAAMSHITLIGCCDISISDVAITDEQCPGDNDGTITVTAACASCTNGNSDIEYSIDGTNFQTSNVFTGLSPNTYTVTVIDGNDTACNAIEVGNVINTSTNDLAISGVETDATCPGGMDGSVDISLTGGDAGSVTAYSEDFEDGTVGDFTLLGVTGVSIVATNVDPPANGGTYSLNLIGGTNSHTTSVEADIPTSNPIGISYYIKTTAVGFSGYLDFLSSSDGTVFTSQFNSGGNYTLGGDIVVPGYVADQWYFIEFKNMDWVNNQYDLYVDGILVLENDFFSGTDISKITSYNYQSNINSSYDEIVITEAGGVSYTVNWEDASNPGNSISTDEDISNLSPGTYNVTVTDGSCDVEGNYTVGEDPDVTNPVLAGCTGTASFDLDLCNEYELTVADLGITATDDCDASPVITLSQTLFTTTGTTTVTVIATDLNGNSASCDVVVTMNTNPDFFTITASPDTDNTCLESAVTFAAADLLSNDNATNGANLEIQEVSLTNPADGTLVDNMDGTYTFTPAVGVSGEVNFDYIVVTDGDDLYNPDNGHFYEFVAAQDIEWTAARDAAELRVLNGVNGYLATVTTQEENDFIETKLEGHGWLGGLEVGSITSGEWRWVTGPETDMDGGLGLQFWNGNIGGTSVMYQGVTVYSNWRAGEPNNFTGEQYLHMRNQPAGAEGQWNDYPIDGFPGNGAETVAGYVVEYGGVAGCAPAFSATGTLVITVIDCCSVAFEGETIITTHFGTGTAGYSGDGGQADVAEFNFINDIIIDGAGNKYVLDANNYVVRKIDASGIVTTIAGNGTSGDSGDGGQASSAQIGFARSLAFDPNGDLLIADSNNNKIKKVDLTTGVISTIVGTGNGGYSGDGGQAINADIFFPAGMAYNSAGEMYFTDSNNSVVRKVDASGIISTVISSGLSLPAQIAVDANDDLYVMDFLNYQIKKFDTDNGYSVTVIAGTGSSGYTGDGGAATAATLNFGQGSKPILYADGSITYSDVFNNVVRHIDGAGIITTVAGTGASGYSGDGADPLLAELSSPSGVVLDTDGELLIADAGNSVIRKITSGEAIDVVDVSCVGGDDGSLTVSASCNLCANGDADLEYSIDGTNFQTSNIFTGLSANTYTVTIRDSQDTSCSDTMVATVGTEAGAGPCCDIMVSNVAIMDEQCPEDNDGTITVTAACASCTNGASDIEYSIDGTNWQASNVFAGLAPNTFDVSVRDMNDIACTSFEVNNVVNASVNDLAISASETDASCGAVADGAIDLTITGGEAGSVSAYSEDFEDGTVGDFTLLGVTGVSIVATNVDPPANGGTYSLNLIGGTNSHTTSVEADIPTSNPIGISYYIKTTAVGFSGYLDFLSSSDGTVFTSQFNSGGNYTLGGDIVVPGYVADQWYFIEFKNMDWVNNQYDLYVDGILVLENDFFSGTDISKITSYNYQSNINSSYDEIVITEAGGVSYTVNWEDASNPGNTMSTDEDVSNLSPGTYNVTVTDGFCSQEGSYTVEEGMDNTPPTAACLDISLALDATGNASLLGGSSVFTEDFSSETVGNGQTTLTNWTVTGNLDVNNTTFASNPGNEIDMEGTPGNAIIETANPIFMSEGTYEYSMFVGREAPNGTTDEKVQVTIYNLYDSSDIFMQKTFDSADPAVTETAMFTVPAFMEAVIKIEELGPENFGGTMIGSITLTRLSSIIDGGSTDDCGLVTLSYDVTQFDCTNIGVNTVTLTVTDAAGNTDTCESIVTVSDATAPVIACQDVTVTIPVGGGAATLTVAQVDGGTTDNCTTPANLSYVLGQTSFDCMDAGASGECTTISTLAGMPTTAGHADGTGSAAQFSQPRSVVADAAGNIFVCDYNNNVIRKITPAGVVTTFAGQAGVTGFADGTGAAATFNRPSGIAMNAAGDIYVGSSSNYILRKITPAGVVTTIAGTPGVNGSADGTGAAASFSGFRAVDIASNGDIYVGGFNNIVRKVTPAGVVTTIAGTAGVAGHLDGNGAVAQFNIVSDIAIDDNDNLYVVEFSNRTLRKITPTGDVTTLAGQPGVAGYADGTGSSALFNAPTGVAYHNGYLYVADQGNRVVRKVSLTGEVTTIAGQPGVQGTMDGGTSGQLHSPFGIDIAADGSIYIGEVSGQVVRKIGYVADCSTTTLTVTDEAGNSALCYVNVIVDATNCCDIAIDSITPTDESCAANDGTVTIVATCGSCANGNADIEYSIDGVNFQMSNVLADVAANNYSNITVRDANNNSCIAVGSTTVGMGDDLTSPTAVAQDITVQVDEFGNANFDIADIENGSTDDCSSAGNLSFSIDQPTLGCGGVQSSQTFVTDADWRISTVTAPGGSVGATFNGYSTLPDASTYTDVPTTQTNPCQALPGAQSLYAGSNIKFFRRTFTLNASGTVDFDLSLNVDNQCDIYINGVYICREENWDVANFQGGIYHKIHLNESGVLTNGYNGGQTYDDVNPSIGAGVFIAGENELVVVVRNPSVTSDIGGLSAIVNIVEDVSSTPVTLTVTDEAGNSGTAISYVTVEDIIAPTFVDNSAFLLYENDFETYLIEPFKDAGCNDLNFASGINTLYGPEFQQRFTVEVLLVNGDDDQYNDATGQADNFAIGIQNRDQEDRLALTFDTQGKNFLNLKMDLSAISLFPCFGTWNATTPSMLMRIYDSPNGVFNINSPGTLLDSQTVTGESPANPGISVFDFNWAEVIAAFDVTGSTDGNVTIEFDLVASQYAGFDNIVITSSDFSIENFPPADVTITCLEDLSIEPNASAVDNCDGQPLVEYVQSPINFNTNDQVITRTWTATDISMNTATYVQTITVDDPTNACNNNFDFVTTWKTTGNNESITIPTNGIYSYDYTIDWGDGSATESGITGDATHSYATPGTYTVQIGGDFPAIRTLNSYTNAMKLESIEQWGNIEWYSMEYAFVYAANMVYNATDAPDLSNATSLFCTFYYCNSFDGDLSNWNTSTIDNMYATFAACPIFNGNIGTWDVSNVTDMRYMFYNASSFNQPLNNWDTASASDLVGLFYNATAYNQPMNEWNLSNITDLRSMFYRASAFNQDISAWDVSNVTDVRYMFANATAFNQDIGAWNVTNVTKAQNMLDYSGLDLNNYDATLIGWAGQNVKQIQNYSSWYSYYYYSYYYSYYYNNTQRELGARGLKYCVGDNARNVLESKGWKAIGDAKDAACFTTCDCDPDISPLIPNTAGGIHEATVKCDDGVFTHYCDNLGRLLLSLDSGTAANVPPSDVNISILPGIRYYQQYCEDSGGSEDGSCFIANEEGAIILCRTWDVNTTETNANVRYYFDDTDVAIVNDGIVNLGLTPIDNIEQFWFYKVIGGSGHEKPEDINLSEVIIVDNDGSSTPTTTNWVLGETGLGDYFAEYVVSSFSGGGGGGAEKGASPICPAIEGNIIGNEVLSTAGYSNISVTIEGGLAPYSVTLSDGTIITDYESGDPISVYAGQTTGFSVLTIKDANDCPHSALAGTAIVYVNGGSDTEAPMAICQDVALDLDPYAQANIAVIQVDAGSFDNDSEIANYELSQSSFNCEDGSNIIVTMTVTDFSGNSASCTSEITVSDPLSACCPDMRNIPYPPADIKTYDVDRIITSDGTVKVGEGATKITYNAGNIIELGVGFEVEKGAIFDAIIDPCSWPD